MKPACVLLAAAAVFASSACNAEKGSDANAGSSGPIEAVAPPKGGDWTKMVSRTPAGGFIMGNPNAGVKLIEFGSMTCPHCAEFDAQGAEKLINNYVKTGRVSYEFRNYVRDPFDLAAALITRCGGPQRFFPLTHAMFASQRDWTGKLQNVPPDQLQALAALPPKQQFTEIARLAGFQQWASQRGLPVAKTSACLTDQNDVNQLVQMTGEATTQYPEFQGTPTFVINGKLVQNAASWGSLEPKLREALGERG
jgi:protein-disulfide isomerase